jgi:SulP family sulfate permease
LLKNLRALNFLKPEQGFFNSATKNYGVIFLNKWWKRVYGDMMGGTTAAIVALPLALAFGIASGAGAEAGLYASIFGGLAAAIFGGCGVQITGPTGAMTVVLVGIIKKYGISGMLLAGVLAGLMQIVFGLLRMGGFVKYLPQPVIAGFTNGVSILFFITAIDDAIETVSITAITAAVILLALRFFKRVPESLFGFAAGLVANELFIHSPHVVGAISFGIPKFSLGTMPFSEISHLIMPAFTIFLLGSISALLSAEVTDGILGTKHDSNRELIGQGLANIVSSLFGGMPVSGAVARSGVNIQSGGRTRLSGILHAIFLMLMVLAFGPIVKRIPLASLSAILMVASIRTADLKSIKRIPRARWIYGAIMIITTILTVVKDLTVAVAAGVILSGVSVLVELVYSPHKVTIGKKARGRLSLLSHPDIELIALHGPLFFVGAENLRSRLSGVSGRKILILDLSDVFFIDETGALVLWETIMKMKENGRDVYIVGLNRKPMRILIRMGIIDSLGRDRVFRKIENAVKKAFEEISQDEGDKFALELFGEA